MQPHVLNITDDPAIKADFIHYFCESKEELQHLLPQLKDQVKDTGMIWVSWKKQTKQTRGEIDENMVRNVALAIGMVDVKVCAVDETWSGLKLVVRKENRK